jgi:hypothetical protein
MNATRKKSTTRKPATSALAPPGAFAPPPPPEEFGKAAAPANTDQVETSALSLHDLFTKQASTILKRADLDEDQKQSILIAMSCPCCGAGGMSFTAKLKRR